MSLRAIIFMLAVLVSAPVQAQNVKELDKLDEKFSRHFEKVLPGWKHRRLEPVWKGENVLIQVWSKDYETVKISVVPHRSAIEARDTLQMFVKTDHKRELTDTGDESYALGYGQGTVAFRRGKFTIYVSCNFDVDSDPETMNLSQAEKVERDKAERKRLAREFAKHAAAAIDNPE